MFSYEFYEIFKNTFVHRTPPVAASEYFSFIPLSQSFLHVKRF